MTHATEWTPLDGPYEIVDAPMWWHLRGLSETASGYGKRLNSGRLVKLPDGRTRRMYVTIFSNIGTCWIVLDGARRIIRDL
jgi:hypothetical protein